MPAILKVCNRTALFRALSSKAGGSPGAAAPPKTASPKTSSTGSSASPKKPSSVSSSADVPGLSNKVVAVPSTEVGPGASKSSNYKNPEYFSYHKFSYAEAEMEMIKFRIPQPSSRA